MVQFSLFVQDLQNSPKNCLYGSNNSGNLKLLTEKEEDLPVSNANNKREVLPNDNSHRKVILKLFTILVILSIMNSCKIPIPIVDENGDNRWISIHNRFISETKQKDADVIFIGDSIIQALQHTDVWNELFVPLHCLNFGIHRDRVENVLWRIQNGELENVKPKVIVLHVGTNNYDNSPEEIVDGILEIINTIKEKHPDVYLVLPTLLPRGQNPNTVRDKLSQVNELLYKNLEVIPKLELVSIDKGFIQPDGTISHHDMDDYLLLTNAGSKKAFEPVYEIICQLLQEGEPEKDLTPSE